jgi:hypothetical protein
MLIPLSEAQVEVNPENGFLIVRYGGLVQACKITKAEVDVLLALRALYADHTKRSDRTIGARARTYAAAAGVGGSLRADVGVGADAAVDPD